MNFWETVIIIGGYICAIIIIFGLILMGGGIIF